MAHKFRFQSLLDYRSRLVEDRQIDLGQAQRALQSAQKELADLRASRERFAQELSHTVSQGSLKIDEVQHQYRYLGALDQMILAQQEVVAETEDLREQARAALETALKDRKTLEKLKEYDQTAQAEALRKHEADALDDINISRYIRNG